MRRNEWRSRIMDFAYVAGVLAFFAITWGFVLLCEKVG
jgi:hypothetical protein